MTQFKVDTVQLSRCANNLQSLQWKMEQIHARLQNVQLNKVLQVRASSALVGRVLDCTLATDNQASNFRKLSDGLEQLKEIYKSCETNLKDPKTEQEANKEDTRDFWDGIFDFGGKLNAPFGIGAAVWNLVTGDLGEKVSGIDDLLSGGAELLEKGVKLSEDANAVWWKELLGFAKTEKKSFGKLLDESIEEFFPGKNATVAKKVTAAADWAGVALSFVGSGIDNYDEFEGDMGSGRYWAETIMEGALDVGKGLLIGAAVGAALGGAPAIVVAGVGAGIGLAVDWACEQFFGKDVTELISDAILDTGERIIEGVGEGVRQVGEAISEGVRQVGQSIKEGAEATWKGICSIFA